MSNDLGDIYSQGIMSDGPVILKNGIPLTPDEIVNILNIYHHAILNMVSILSQSIHAEGYDDELINGIKSLQDIYRDL
jgi:hypothetical protein